MKVLAFSDLHGRYFHLAARLIEEHRPDWVVLLGDLLPEFEMVGGEGNRLACQRDCWQKHGACFERAGTPVTFIRGNHEIEGFEVPSEFHRVPAQLQARVIRIEGIPAEFGASGWSRERGNDELKAELDGQISHFPLADIVLCHVPPFGYLDEAEPGIHLGHRPLASWLGSAAGSHVSLVLCGHIHEAMGLGRCGNALVVNLATGYALLGDLDGRWEVRKLESMSSVAAHSRMVDEDDCPVEIQ